MGGIGYFSGNGAYYLDVDAAVTSQDYAANTSTYYWRVIVTKTSGTGYWSANSGSNNFSSSWASSGSFAYDFRNSTPQSMMLAEGYSTFAHDANGYGSINYSASANMVNLGSASASGSLTGARIPKAPVTNGAPVVSAIMPTTATVTWPANTNNNGASIDQYLLRINKNTPADSAGYTDYALNAATLTKALTGLTPGTTYYAVVYAHNGQGYAPKSAQTTFKTLSGAYTWNGSAWKPCEIMTYKSTGWTSAAETRTWNGTAWVLAS